MELKHRMIKRRALLGLMLGAVLAGVVFGGAAVYAQFASPTGDRGPMNDTFGGSYKDPQQRAADNLARGLRYKSKADHETNEKAKAKLLDKAKKEFQSSIALHPNHDAYLALGLLQIEMGQKQAAAESCHQALALKPGSEAAGSCERTAMSSAPPSSPPAAGPPPSGGGRF